MRDYVTAGRRIYVTPSQNKKVSHIITVASVAVEPGSIICYRLRLSKLDYICVSLAASY